MSEKALLAVCRSKRSNRAGFTCFFPDQTVRVISTFSILTVFSLSASSVVSTSEEILTFVY